MTSKEMIVEMIREKFGLKDGIKFNLLECDGNLTRYSPYVFRDGVLFDKDNEKCLYDEVIEIASYWENIEVIKEPLLTKEEREYLKVSVKYSTLKVDAIVVITDGKQCCVELYQRSKWDMLGYVTLEFNGLELNKHYTLKELGLED